MRFFKFRSAAKNNELYSDAQKFPVPIVNFDKKYVFYWTAKSGCTQATKAILGDVGVNEPDFTSKFKTNEPNYVDDIRNHYYRKYRIKVEKVYKHSLDHSYVNMKLVRNPYDRAVSSFLMLMRDFIDYENDGTKILEETSLAADIEKKNLSFMDFCRYLKIKDLYSSDWHIQVQSHPFEINGDVKINEILRLENYKYDFERVKSKYKLNIYIKKKGNFHHHNKIDEGFQGNVAKIPFLEYSKKIPTYKNFFNDEAFEIINDKYKKDFKLYGYEFGKL